MIAAFKQVPMWAFSICVMVTAGTAHAGYVKNNPLNATDPTGNDEVVVYRPLGPGVESVEMHTAKYVGNDSGGWTYMSKDGVAGHPGDFSGPSKFTEVSGIKNLGAVEKDAAGRGYTEGFKHAESPLNDAKNIRATEAAGKTDYNLVCANCGQAVTAGDKAGGLPTDTGPYPGPAGAEAYRSSARGASDGWQSVPIPHQDPPAPSPDKRTIPN